MPQEVNEGEQNYYLVADLAYTSANIKAITYKSLSIDSFVLDNSSEMLSKNLDAAMNTLNILPYAPTLLVTFDPVLDDALFAPPQDTPIFNLNLAVDHNRSTLNAINISINYVGSNLNNILLKVRNNNDGGVLSQAYLNAGSNLFSFVSPLGVTENTKGLTFILNIGSVTSASIKFAINEASFLMDFGRVPSYSFQSVSYNIRSQLHPHKVRAVNTRYVNNMVSLNLVVTLSKTEESNSVLCEIKDKLDNNVIVSFAPMIEGAFEVSGVTVDSNTAVKAVSLYSIPFEQGRDYQLSLKAQNALGFESDVFTWALTADLTKPTFVKNKMDIAQIKNASSIKHKVFWGSVVEDVSAVSVVEVYSRTGQDPEWVLNRTVSYPASFVEVDNLKNETSYYYKVRALNTAGLFSDYLIATDPISTGMPTKVLTNLSNYPNPFNSNLENTTIYYYLNQNKKISIKIYNIYGKTLYESNYFEGGRGGMAGANEIEWNGTDQMGNKLPLGGYPMIIYDAEAKEVLGKRVIAIIH